MTGFYIKWQHLAEMVCFKNTSKGQFLTKILPVLFYKTSIENIFPVLTSGEIRGQS